MMPPATLSTETRAMVFSFCMPRRIIISPQVMVLRPMAGESSAKCWAWSRSSKNMYERAGEAARVTMVPRRAKDMTQERVSVMALLSCDAPPSLLRSPYARDTSRTPLLSRPMLVVSCMSSRTSLYMLFRPMPVGPRSTAASLPLTRFKSMLRPWTPVNRLTALSMLRYVAACFTVFCLLSGLF